MSDMPSAHDKEKISRILATCRRPDLDLDRLAELAELASSPGGLINDHIRRIACPPDLSYPFP
jgi:hypothetical protein